MALATQCPHCNTVFRVANDQLKLHSGVVRCGACQQTFNGVEHLLPPSKIPAQTTTHSTTQAVIQTTKLTAEQPLSTTSASATIEPASITVSALPDMAVFDATPENLNASEESLINPEPAAAIPNTAPSALSSSLDFDMEYLLPMDFGQVTEANEAAEVNQTAPSEHAPEQAENDIPMTAATPTVDDLSDMPNDLDAQIQTTRDDTDRTSQQFSHDVDLASVQNGTLSDESEQNLETDIVGIQSKVKDAALDDTEIEKPSFVLQAERQQGIGKKIRIAMIVLLLFMIPAAIGQAGYSFRNQIAAWFPQTKPMLIAACKPIRCNINLLTQIDQISVESTELQTLPLKKNHLLLTVQLLNKSGTTQAWPMIELSLNDSKDKPLAVKAFSPESYLSNKVEVQRGFQANGEQTIKIYFELTKVKAAMYRSAIYYP